MNRTRRWLKTPWIDRYSGETFRITTRSDHGGSRVARVQTYGDVIESYEYHPEAKFADAHGETCGKQTRGLLQRRHVRIGVLTNIGKESHSLEEVQAGIEHEESDVYTEYRDARRSLWNTSVLPAVKKAPLVALERMCKANSREGLLLTSERGEARHTAGIETYSRIFWAKWGCFSESARESRRIVLRIVFSP